MDKRWRWIGGGAVAATAAVGVAAWWFNRAEQPRFTLVQRDGAIEVREYPAALVAQTVQAGLREAALSKGFERLADYIFARSRMGERIAMTAPVVSDGAGDAGWRTRFFMPQGKNADSLPAPEHGISIEKLPARRVAAIRFSGAPDDAMLAEQEAALRGWLDAAGHRAAGAAEHAYYDAPFIPAPLRRNEIWLPLA